MRTALTFVSVVVALLGAQTARASSPEIEIEYLASMGTYNDLEYFHIEGLMTGEVERHDGSSGTYEVPVEMVYPEGGGNGIAIAEGTNPTWFGVFHDGDGNPVMCPRGERICEEGDVEGRRLEDQAINYGRPLLGSHIMRGGYTYMAFTWDNLVTDALGPEPPPRTTRRYLAYGTIEDSEDALFIMEDVASWLRNPEGTTGIDAPDINASDYVIAFGFSVPGIFLRAWLNEGYNEVGGELVYDAALILVSGGMCHTPDTPGEIFPCPGPPATGDARVLALDTQTDLETLAGGIARDPGLGTEDEAPNHVRWEIAGVSHLPSAVHNHFFLADDADQNPVEFNPVVRAGLHHLARWVTEDEEPPPSKHIAGELEDGVWTTGRDEDGNALGGVRLPHLPREAEEGTIGAPLGVYEGTQADYAYDGGLALNDPHANIYLALSGEFTRFSEDRLQELYPGGHEDYRERYLAALDAIIEEGYVLEEDRDFYLARAERGLRSAPGGEGDAGVDPPPANGEGGCATFNPATASGLTALLSILLAAAVRPVIARRFRNEPRYSGDQLN